MLLFRKILNEATVQPIHLNQKFFVVVTGSAQNRTGNSDEALQILWMNNLIDSHVLTQDATNSWALYTFLPYQADCITPSHLRIESFTKSNFSKPMNLSHGQVYPEKLKDFNGCPIYISPYVFKPNLYIDKTIDGRFYYKGFEIIITGEISKHLNFTIVYDIPLTRTEHGMIFENRSIGEIFELVFKSNLFKLDFKY